MFSSLILIVYVFVRMDRLEARQDRPFAMVRGPASLS